MCFFSGRKRLIHASRLNWGLRTLSAWTRGPSAFFASPPGGGTGLAPSEPKDDAR